jgi:endoglucanase
MFKEGVMNFQINRGTNISHWLSQSTNRGIERQTWFTQADVKRIAGWGMDYIRLPVDEEQMWTKDGQREEEAFALLHNALEWCAAEKLKVIVDLHILRSHYFNDSKASTLYSYEKEMQKFAWFWQDLSAFLGSWGNEFLAYELLNEAVAKDNADWNKVYPYPFQAIRQRESERTIILGSNKYNQWSTFPDLKIPEDDNLILTFHYYNPMFVTHYKAEWTPIGQYDGPINYPGVPVDDKHTYLFELAKNPIPTYENRYFDIEILRDNISVPSKLPQNTVTSSIAASSVVLITALTISEASGTMISGKCFKKMILPGLTGIIRELLVYWIEIPGKKRLHCTP